jgi:hypothetical protein
MRIRRCCSCNEVIAVGMAVSLACMAKSEQAAPEQAVALQRNRRDEVQTGAGAAAPQAPGPVELEIPRKIMSNEAPEPGAASKLVKVDAGKDGTKTTEKTPEGPTRAWFPETFLFEPLVVTDDRGSAVVPVRVPDRLTTWRVLALAHSRAGAQGGAVTSFLGTLPTYVDPVVPSFLVQGDTVRMPIQIVNTTEEEVASSLEVTAVNARLVTEGNGSIAGGNPRGMAGRAGGPAWTAARSVPAQSSTLDHVTLTAERAGTIKLRVALGGTDAVERVIEVRPAGRLVTQTRSGTLALPRTFAISGAAGGDPSTDRVRLQVFPGALALQRSELAVSTARGGAGDDAYALLLAGKATALLTALGDKPDPAALRELAILTAQRAIRTGRTLDVPRATLLLEPALAHPDNPVLARLGERAAAYLAQNQRPDGTFSGQTGWTLQRVLIATAEAVRASSAAQGTAAQRQRGLQIATRAAGAFARTSDQVTDGYTAAAIVASHSVSGELAEVLRRRVRGALKPSADGAKYLEVGDGVVRADGVVPTQLEATALAVLALDGDAQAPLADLGTALLGGYSTARGWGDGQVNLVAMQAVLALFKTPLPRAVTVTLTMDGAPIVRGTLEGAKLRDVLALDGPAPGLAGAHQFQLVAEPAVPGLGYSLSLDSWLPWDKEPSRGLELALPARVDATVGKAIDLTVTAVAPSGIALHIQQALPAGVQVDAPSLEAQVSAGTIERFVAADGTLDLYVPPLRPGATFSLTYRAVPTLGGTLHSGASLIEAGMNQFHVPPAVWTIDHTGENPRLAGKAVPTPRARLSPIK